MKATLAHLVHDQTLARRDDDAKPNEQASPRLHRGTFVRPLLNGVHESIKILYEAGKDIERGQSIAEHMMTRRGFFQDEHAGDTSSKPDLSTKAMCAPSLLV